MADPVNHLIRTNHHDTGEVEMYCDEVRARATDEIPGAGVCTRCIVAAIESSNALGNQAIDDLARTVQEGAGADFRRILGWIDGITLRLERLERKAAKKGGRR